MAPIARARLGTAQRQILVGSTWCNARPPTEHARTPRTPLTHATHPRTHARTPLTMHATRTAKTRARSRMPWPRTGSRRRCPISSVVAVQHSGCAMVPHAVWYGTPLAMASPVQRSAARTQRATPTLRKRSCVCADGPAPVAVGPEAECSKKVAPLLPHLQLLSFAPLPLRRSAFSPLIHEGPVAHCAG